MNTLKEMSAVIETRRRVAKAFEKVQPMGVLKLMAKAIADLKTEMTTKLNLMTEAIANIQMEMTTSRSAYMRIENGSFVELCEIEAMKPSVVEDVDEFNALVVKIANAKSNYKRIRMCQEVMALIREAIGRWQSKIDKFAAMSMGAGNSENETRVALVKTEAFKHAIEKLRERGEVISQAHDKARGEIERFLKRDEKNFKPMYVNR